MPALNVTCGDIAAALLAQSGLEGQALPAGGRARGGHLLTIGRPG